MVHFSSRTSSESRCLRLKGDSGWVVVAVHKGEALDTA